MSAIVWAVIWLTIGAACSETIRAFYRKISKGRFFGPVPGKDTEGK